ncbi:Orc1/CDC6 [Giardia duodenalis]|uniref:Origin recognition complex subunit 1 n=1 Tax=Giardia intestinalis (strain ATCC 50803 / WB clone C6) TaxID=184922 RepID=A8BJA4_GIAIC|nr:Orc1/CDC6 [Giardia intestinalis]KAE8304852.1 Orc1/CDC6 [Giardia intestinalis]|eukprot:XP_001706772.1 Orc1/CDC6 [Giardia lamblia ATCC 50803]
MLRAAAAAFGLAHRPVAVVGRDAELSVLADVLSLGFADGTAHGLFLSGNPGTGKTLCLRHVCRLSPSLQGALQIWINAALLARPEQVYQELHCRIFSQSRRMAPLRAKKALEAHFQRQPQTKRNTLIVIDEVDHLQSKNDQIFYFLYNTLLTAPHPLLFVSIANSLYFPYTDRIASRLSGITKLEFPAYSPETFTSIIKARIQELSAEYTEVNQLFQNDAVLKLLVGRVLHRGGDIRTALQFTFRTIARTVAEGLTTIPLRIVDQITCADLSESALCATELTKLEHAILKTTARDNTTIGSIIELGHGGLGIQQPLCTNEPPSLNLIERAISRLCTSGLILREPSADGYNHLTESDELYKSTDKLYINVVLD